jgi:hypothetical protein
MACNLNRSIVIMYDDLKWKQTNSTLMVVPKEVFVVVSTIILNTPTNVS